MNEPANLLSPEKLADAAREVSKRFGLECDVLDRDQMTKLGMGALLGVAQGSDNPPFLIVMKYQPEEKGADHLALVGKGVTSIRAEIPIKPADSMGRMKYDMAGAAAVIGAMGAIAQLKAWHRSHGFHSNGGKHAQRPRHFVQATLSPAWRGKQSRC